ncbi:MAG: hypothetical protein C4554_11510 [Dethiobacter sp.]|jgi:hypothetical protein|nr:MAG: hypothetical protein C4554_11510 [Dethiobacter sp.]
MVDKKHMDIIIDYVPENIKKIIESNVDMSEDIKAVIKGIKGEALAITDKGVYIIQHSGDCYFYDYGRIKTFKLYRELRRGKYLAGFQPAASLT